MIADSPFPSPKSVSCYLVTACGEAGTGIIDEIHSVWNHPFRAIAMETAKPALDLVHADVYILFGENQIKAGGKGDPAKSGG